MYGDGPGETFEGMTTLAALSGLTSRIRLGAAGHGRDVSAPVGARRRRRSPSTTRRHGRLELSLGAAWFDKEHHELGIPFPSTARALRPAAGHARDRHPAVHRRDRRATQGRQVSLQQARMLPLPVQRPHPPIWIGGTGPRRTLPLVGQLRRRLARLGQPEQPARGQRRASTSSPREAGRDPSSILRASSLSLDDLDTARKHAAKWRDAGYGYLVCGWPDAGAVAGRGVRPRRDARVRGSEANTS